MFRPALAATALIFLNCPALKETPVFARSKASQLISGLPLHFEADRESGFGARYIARTPRYTVSFGREDALISSPAGNVRLRMEGAAAREPEGVERQAGRANYFIGNDPAKWRTNVAHFSRVRYREVYPGIDVVYYGNQRELEYDFVVAPGADPRAIQLRFDGAESVRITSAGALAIQAGVGEMLQHKPVVYQETDGARRPIAGGYVIQPNGAVGFELGDYDPARTLVIDPVLTYSTYLGGTLDETARAIAVDSSGHAYVAGRTSSTRFTTQAPAPNPYRGAVDVFVAKLNPAGNALVYLTYIGGTALDSAFGIAVDESGNAYVAGQTNSTDFPTLRPIQSTVRGTDGFVLKLNPAGNALVYSTYLGGSGTDIAEAVAVDLTGSAYVTGFTQSTDFPTRAPFSGTLGGPQDAFVTKLAVDGTALVYSTYLGGSGIEIGTGIAVELGAAFVTGGTASTNFPMRFPFQSTRRGPTDIFVTKFNQSGASLLYSTYFGGSGDENPGAIAVDSSGEIYVTGSTASADLFVLNAVQSTLGGAAGGFDAFVVKADFSGIPIYSTYLGGSGDDQALDIAADETGNAYVVGSTGSANFPVLGALQPSRGNDGFVTQLSPTGALRFSTFIGGNGSDAAIGVAVDPQNNILVTGLTSSADFPLMGAIQSSYAGAAAPGFGDAFVAKISPAGGPSVLSLVPSASFAGDTVAPDSIVAAFGQGLAAGLVIAGSDFPTLVGGVNVRVTDSAGVDRLAQIYFVSAGQVNFVMPPGTAIGNGRVDILRDGQVAASGTVKVDRVAPSLYTANSNGSGPAAALFQRFAADGSQTSGLTFQCASAGNCTNVPLDPGSATDQLIVLLFGTGIRGRSTVSATVGGQAAEVLGAVAQGQFPAFDQVNLRIARSLIARGQVNVVVTVDGKAANTVTLNVGGTLPPPAPSLTAANPNNGVQGQAINTLALTGQNLGTVTSLEFSPAADITVSDLRSTATTANAVVTIGANAATGARTLSVVSPSGRSNTLTFTVNVAPPPPAITSVSPNSVAQGESGATLTINGTNLTAVTALEFTPSTGITVSNLRTTANSLTAQVSVASNAAAGPRTLAVVTPSSRSNTLAFEITAATPPPTSEYFPIRTGLAWDYKVNIPAAAALPFQPIIEAPAGLLCASIFCGTSNFAAGDLNFSIAVNQSLGVINGGESFRVTVTDPGPRFYFANAGPMELRVRNVSGSPQLEIIQTVSTFRLVRPLARPTAAELAQTQSLTVAAGTFPDVVKTVLTLVGNGIDLRGTFTTDVFLARGVGLIKAEMKDSTGRTLFTQELTRFTQPVMLAAVNPFVGEPGQTVTVNLTGAGFENATGVQFASATGITVSGFTATANQVTFQAAIAADANPGTRFVRVLTPSGNSDFLTFAIRRPGPTPAIGNLFMTITRTGASAVAWNGTLDFFDPDGDIFFTGVLATSARLRFQAAIGSLAVCASDVAGVYLDKRGQTSGSVQFDLSASGGRRVDGDFTINVSLLDAAGNLSSTVQVDTATWQCP